MNALFLCFATLLAGDAQVEVRVVDGECVVDASGSSIVPATFLRRLAQESQRTLRGEDVLLDAEPIDLHLHARPFDAVLRALALATNTNIAADGRTITISPAGRHAKLEDMELETQAAWLRLARDFPEHEVARFARVELGRTQERLGHEEAALAHYDAAVRTDVVSPAMEEALQAASDLLSRRGEWGEAQRRLSMLAVHASADSLRASARIAMARALARQGRGTESLALLDAVDLSYPPHDDREVQERRLVRARGHLAAGDAADALRELDLRATAHAALGLTPEDLELRARALDAAGSPLEASRAWLACAALSSGREKQDALLSAARLAKAGGDDLALLLIARLTDGGEQAALVQRMADEAREHLGLDGAPADSVEALEARWKERLRLAPSDRVTLAARCVTALARSRSLEDAAQLARTALAELDGADGSPVRAALAASYERRGLWPQAARVWNGGGL